MSTFEWRGHGSSRPAEFRLSTVELDACYELLGLGGTPPMLDLPSPGRTVPERRDHLDTVLLGLRRRGLADTDQPNDQVAGLVRVLARPDHQFDLSIHGRPDDRLVAIGAAASGRGTLAVRRGDQVSLTSVRSAALVPGVIGLIEPINPGRGASMNVPADLFEAAWKATTDGHLSSFVERLTDMGVPRANVSSCIHMCHGIRAVGQLGTVHYEGQTPRLGAWTIGFHRAETGDYLQLRKPGDYGGETVTICPLDPHRLNRLAEELLNAGPAPRPQHRHLW